MRNIFRHIPSNSNSKKIFFGFVFLLTISIHAAAQYWGDLKMGPSMVGFKAVHLYDYSRTFQNKTDTLGNVYAGERARPIQICVWSPISAKDNKPDMIYEDYLWLMTTELKDVKLNDSLKNALIKDILESEYIKEKLEKTRKENMYAKNNASSPSSSGKH